MTVVTALPRGVSKTASIFATISLDPDGVDVVPERAPEPYPNAIRTTRFTPLTWLPKSLYYQFHRVANIYFVMIATISCIPWVHAKWQPKVLTLLLILLAQALKDLYEDLKRWRDDKEENTRSVRRFDPCSGAFDKVLWRELDAGDVCIVRKGATFPADLLVLASSDQSGSFYVSTKSMDGETNLKERSVPSVVNERFSWKAPSRKISMDNFSEDDVFRERQEHLARELHDMNMEVQLERPHPSVSDLDCSMTLDADVLVGLSCQNFGLRGHQLQNTTWVIGLVCYVGCDTKVQLNSFPPPSKSSELERYLNRCVMCIIAFLVGTSAYFALASRLTEAPGEDLPLYKIFPTYLVILYPVLPMTLYIAFEMLHLIIGMQIEMDPLMCDPETREHAKARNTSVVEELGQVDFVFSDKTGTLTANEMRFAFCSIGKVNYGPFLRDACDRPGPGIDQVSRVLRRVSGAEPDEVLSFFDALAVCHTVQLDEDGTYKGESPDEVALVEAAKAVGCVLEGREAGAGVVVHRVRSPDGSVQENELRHVLGFTSDRKRMSVVVAAPGGGATVITKGSDNVMEGLLAEPLPQEAHVALSDFSRQGLRTLVVAKRRLSASEYAAWRVKWEEAGSEMEDRAAKLDAVAAQAEVGLTYLGVTALEDRLQDRVPETIATLRETGLRVWVLTGDKVETAIEIAKSCRLIDDDMSLVRVVGASDSDECMQILRDATTWKWKGLTRGMVLDGQSVRHILSDEEARSALYDVAIGSSSCVCCRLSPLQKRELVELVRAQNPKAITLSIGDGANDVPMIQGAHVGIGVRGKEGAAAVQVSDMAVSQFSFLGNLVLCHGRKAYRRISTFLLFFMYKSLALGWSYIIYAHSTMFSGEGAYPQWLDVVWNPLTSCAIVLMLATDVDFHDQVALNSPHLYAPGPLRQLFNQRVFGRWMFIATAQGTIAWLVPVYGLTTHQDRIARPRPEGGPFWQASFTAFTTLFLVVHLKIMLIAERPFQLIGIVSFVLELLSYVPVAIGLGSSLAPSQELLGAPGAVFSSGPHLLALLLVPLAAVAAPEALLLWYDRRCCSSAGSADARRRVCTGHEGHDLPMVYSGESDTEVTTTESDSE